MHKLFLIFGVILFVLMNSQVISGQQNQNDDKIIQKDGKQILCKVLKISKNKVRFDPKGPMSLKTISADNIKRIEFSTGKVLEFPLSSNYQYTAETKDYDSSIVVRKKRRQLGIISLAYGPYEGDDTEPILGNPTRFDNAHIFGIKAALYQPELESMPGTLGFNMVLSFSEYSLSSQLLGRYEKMMYGTAINLDISGEYLLFDVRKLYIPNPMLMVGGGITRFIGDEGEVNELDFSLNYGAGIRVLISKRVGMGFSWKRRPVWVKDMGSPNFTEVSGELFFQTNLR